MKFTINREKFLNGLTIVSSSIPSKSTSPIFLNYYLEIQNSNLVILGSDGTIIIKHTIEKKDGDKDIILNEDDGKCLVAAKFFIEIIRKLEGEYVTLELVDNTILRISNEITEYELRTVDGNEYPDLLLEANDNEITLDYSLFQKLVDATCFAAAKKSPRKILEGENIKCSGHTLSFATTDSFRLARKIVEINEEHDFSYTVPVTTLMLVSHLDGINQIKISFDTTHAVFSAGNTIISTRLLIGDYPWIDKIIPTSFMSKMEIDSQKFIQALERISLVAIERENVVKFLATDSTVILSAKSVTLGSSKETIIPESYDGDRLEMSFNSVYVIEAIKALNSSKVYISFVGEGKGFTITSDEPGVLQLITPVRTAY